MKLVRHSLIIAAILAGCGSAPGDTVVQPGVESTTTTAAPSTTTTVAPTTSTTADPRVLTREVTSEEGWRYRVSIAPYRTDPNPSANGCVRLASPGKTNISWTLTVENLFDDRPAPWPFVAADINLNEAGTAVDPRASKAELPPFRGVTIDPNGRGPCFLSSVLSTTSSSHPETIPAGASNTFTITAGPVADPIPAGTALLVKFVGNEPRTALPF